MNRCCVIKKVYARRKDYFSTVRVGVRTRRVALKGLMCAVEVPLQRIPAAVVVESVEHGKVGTTKADKALKALACYRYGPVLQICTCTHTLGRRWPDLVLRLRVDALSLSLNLAGSKW